MSGDHELELPGRDIHPDLALAQAIRDLVVELPDVACLDSGVGEAFATWRRGRRVSGVRIRGGDPSDVCVRVVAGSPEVVADLGDRVRSRIRAGISHPVGSIDVHVSDVEIDDPTWAEVPARVTSPHEP